MELSANNGTVDDFFWQNAEKIWQEMESLGINFFSTENFAEFKKETIENDRIYGDHICFGFDPFDTNNIQDHFYELLKEFDLSCFFSENVICEE